ncbi:MAG: hydantoinase/oxoprolinase family protein, partial [Gammaproteobacteria bacterium]|nr:hydantoinase/oxoprolinase family protein [Gammaproteobacteria bacterium]
LAETVAGHRKVDYFLEKPISTSVYDLDRMEPGMSMTGPAIVENATTTIVVSPGKQVRMDDYGNIIITLHSE